MVGRDVYVVGVDDIIEMMWWWCGFTIYHEGTYGWWCDPIIPTHIHIFFPTWVDMW